MLLLFVAFGLASVAALVLLIGSIVLGIALCFSQRFRTAGVFVLLVPTFAAPAAVLGSWGLAFLFDSLSKGAASPQAWQRWQVFTLWAWPVGFIGGAAIGGLTGAVISFLIVKRLRGRTASAKLAVDALKLASCVFVSFVVSPLYFALRALACSALIVVIT